eukprot:5307657-Alexandrium_andersonii.AAC.1
MRTPIDEIVRKSCCLSLTVACLRRWRRMHFPSPLTDQGSGNHRPVISMGPAVRCLRAKRAWAKLVSSIARQWSCQGAL